jgi:3-hydroxyanthranilate 3,4-dioxygenase
MPVSSSTCDKANNLKLINVNEWIVNYKDCFLPPVCNKLMHNEQLVIMFVGGPNQREDYHIEEGEELFYQIKGDMCVKIVENGKHKDVVIKEGEFFILPARVPHSPQRTANSVGLVIERKRLSNETDGVRWFVPETINPLYEKWFYCSDLGVQLIPLIKEYFASDEYKYKMPKDNVLEKSLLPFELNKIIIDKCKHGAYSLLEKINSSPNEQNVLCLTPKELNLQFDVCILRKGTHKFVGVASHLNVWLWQLNGSATVKVKNQHSQMDEVYEFNLSDSLLIPPNYVDKLDIEIAENEGLMMKVVQDPHLANKEF